ncbi:hypothetical protein D3C71_1644110 [compost metagenome]
MDDLGAVTVSGVRQIGRYLNAAALFADRQTAVLKGRIGQAISEWKTERCSGFVVKPVTDVNALVIPGHGTAVIIGVTA